MRWWSNLGLGIKISLLLLLVLGVLLLSTTLLLVANTQFLTQEVGSERVAQEVGITQSRLAEVERELAVDVNFIASSVTFFQAVGRRDADDVREIIEQANESLQLDDVDVVDGDGNRLVDLDSIEDMSAENDLLTLALSGEAVTAVVIEEDEGRFIVSITATAPVVSITGNELGAIQVSRVIDDAFLRELTFERDGIYVHLLFEGGVLARNARDESVSTNAALVQRAEAGETVVLESLDTSGSTPRSVAYIPVASNNAVSPAVLMILVELDEIYTFQNTTLVNTITVFIVLTLLTIAIIYLSLYRLAISPINRVRTIAHQMTSGHYNQRIPISGGDELGQLAMTFNEMASAVQQREIGLQAAREQAERADQVKSAFLASMSHELRTPLNAVINFTKFVIDGDTGPVNEQQVELLSEVVSSAKHLLSLINDVLDMSKIEAGSLKLFVEDNVDIHALLKNAASVGRSLVKDKQVHIEVDVLGDLPLISGDQQRIYQILLNIVSNACKFTDEGAITIDARELDDEIVIAISDAGPGIAPEDQALVFEAFKQTNTGLQHGGGTGLGMPIARSLAEAHGGRLWLESEIGKGSSFYVALPVVSETLVPTLSS